ncbi:hypothetical protein KKJ09_09825 [Xenorhabdus bovienii]|uniref:phage integrase central domain-containing protein n=1 Tax=Xenorhabdus bovienii TaxID=40576 RepID=UPI0023B251B1|nr:hypothetical protein [Xenorhabdus bovienii]MDE9493882.1 hypothetical protein [Xenorhabdus bovienii]MDE9502417.1 hypothetical protein [Xenorhabdus bovienii]
MLFYRGELEQHRNPKTVKRIRKESALKAVTVEKLIREWWKTTMQGAKVKKVNADQILRSFELYVFPKIGSLPHDELTLHIWIALIEDVVKQIPSIGNRILIYSKKAHKWAVRRGITNLTPLSDVTSGDLIGKKSDTEIDSDNDTGERTLNEEELVVLFRIIDALNLSRSCVRSDCD